MGHSSIGEHFCLSENTARLEMRRYDARWPRRAGLALTSVDWIDGNPTGLFVTVLFGQQGRPFPRPF